MTTHELIHEDNRGSCGEAYCRGNCGTQVWYCSCGEFSWRGSGAEVRIAHLEHRLELLENPGAERTYVTGTGQRLNVHRRDARCDDRCVIHNPSDHVMRDFPTHWRTAGIFDIKPSHMERICPHGVGHPDPDALAFVRLEDPALADVLAIHGCDGCCTGENSPSYRGLCGRTDCTSSCGICA